MLDLLVIEWVTKMKLGCNSVEIHPQLSQNFHPVDGALVCAGSLSPELSTSAFRCFLLRARSPSDDEPYRHRNAQFSSLKTKSSSSFELFLG
jgi:hypothetical protein